MNNKIISFKQLHSNFFVLGNAWDAISAKVYENAGFKAIGTSSCAIANAKGLKDGECIKFNEILPIIQDIINFTNIPVSIDIEAGYSEDKENIAKNILQLADIGCVGVNIEDSMKSQVGLYSPQVFAEILEHSRQELEKTGFRGFFINARTDTYLQLSEEKRLTETIARAILYETSGGSGLFVPGLCDLKDIQAITNSTKLPLNIMNLPALPNIEELKRCGVNRLSLGNSVFDEMIAFLEKTVNQSKTTNQYSNHYDHPAIQATQFE